MGEACEIARTGLKPTLPRGRYPEMGLFRRKIKDPVNGTAQIVQCSQPGNPRAINSRCTMFLVIEGPGIEPFSLELKRQVAVARWPTPGMTVPCRIDRTDLGRVEIDLDTIPDWQESARANAAQIAESRAATTSPGGGPTTPAAGAVTVVGANSPEEAADAIRKAELATGMDLNGDRQIG